MTASEMAVDRNPQKWALLIGINEYPKLSSDKQLKGCVNDINAIEAVLLSERFGFPKDNVKKLVNHEGTRNGILTALRTHLVENTKIHSGDVVVVYYSGHGSSITDMHHDEESGYDQTIVPYDSSRRSAEEIRDITDDELALLLDELSQRTKNINFFFDSCHSGTLLRNLEAEGLERWLEPWDGEVPLQEGLPVGEGKRGMGPSDWLPLSEGYVLIASCRSDERSREYSFQNGILPILRTWHGALTYYLLQALDDVGPETTYYDIWDKVRGNVTKKNGMQHPQIEGAFERKVLGGVASPRKRYVEVTHKAAETVTLAAGLALGATAGSRFAIYPQGTQTFEDSTARVAIVRLSTVEALASTGRIEEGDIGQVTIGGSAVEIEHDYGSMQMPVRVVGNHPLLDSVRQAIGESPLLSLVVDENQPSIVTVRLCAPRLSDGSEAALAGDQLHILGSGDGQQLVTPIAPVGSSSFTVRDTLEHIAKYHNFFAIRNVDEQSKLTGKIKIRLFKVIGQAEGAQGRLAPVERNTGGDIILAVGDRVVLEIDNQSNQDVHATILDFNTEWQVKPIFPPAGATDDVVQAKRSRHTNRLKVSLPLHQRPVHQNQPLPREMVKVIATTERVHFRSLWLPALRDGERDLDMIEGAHSSLYQLMELAIGGGTQHVTRSLEEDADPVVKDWTTDELVFFITA